MFSKSDALAKLKKKSAKNSRIRLLNEMLEKHGSQSQIMYQSEYASEQQDQLNRISDSHLFRQAVCDVLPIQNHQANILLPKPKPKRLQFEMQDSENAIFSEETLWLNLECPQQLSWVKHGHDPNLVKRLRKGKCELNQHLDLHGMTVAQASFALQNALQYMRNQHQRYILVIHGKGNHANSSAVIKAKVNEWLRAYPHVLAFASAPLKWGDTGATVVMLDRI